MERADHWHHVDPERMPSVVVPLCIACHHREHIRMRSEAKRAVPVVVVVVPGPVSQPTFKPIDRSEVFDWIDAMIELEALVISDTAWMRED